MDFAFAREIFLTLLPGVPLTLQLAAISVAIGGVLATLIALAGLKGGRLGRALASSYVFVFRGSPLLVQIFLIYYGLGQFRPTWQALGVWTVLREPYWCAIIALALNNAAYSSEIIRGGLSAVSLREVEAARACGMSGLLLARRIVFPLALRQALPAYGNEIVLMVKGTALASVITLMEITGLASRLISETFRAVEVFAVAGAFYLTINFAVTRCISLLERRLNRDKPSPSFIHLLRGNRHA